MQYANDITPLTLASTATLRELHSQLSTKNTTAVAVRSAIESEMYFRLDVDLCECEESEENECDLVIGIVEASLGKL